MRRFVERLVCLQLARVLRCTFLCTLFVTAAVAVSLASAQTNIVDLSTGLDSSNQVLPSGGQNDAHWTVESGQTGVFVPAVTVFPNDPDWLPGWPDNSSDSDWIARTTDLHQGSPSPPYEFRLTFDLTNYNLSLVTITGSWAIDDEGSLSLNGNSFAFLEPWPWNGWPELQQFSVPQGSSFLNQGLNVLTITLGDTYGSDNQQDGVRLEGTVSIPEPGMLAMLAAGLLGMSAYVWRKRK